MANLEEIAFLGAIGALEEAEINANHGRRVYDHRDAFHDLSDNQFIKIYRLSKPLVSELIDLLEPHVVHPTRLSAMNVETKVIKGMMKYNIYY